MHDDSSNSRSGSTDEDAVSCMCLEPTPILKPDKTLETQHVIAAHTADQVADFQYAERGQHAVNRQVGRHRHAGRSR